MCLVVGRPQLNDIALVTSNSSYYLGGSLPGMARLRYGHCCAVTLVSTLWEA